MKVLDGYKMVEEKQYYDAVALGLTVSRYAGIEAICKCPLPAHDDNNASSSFNLETGLFYCFACQRGLTAEKVADVTGGELSLKTKAELPRIRRVEHEWDWVLTCPLATNNKYIQDRLKVDADAANEIVRYFGVKECGIGVAFPLKNYAGNTTGVQIRKYNAGIGAKYLTLGNRPSIYMPQHMQQGVWVTEGVFGVLNAYKYGIQAVSTLGAGVTEQTQEVLSYFAPNVAFDNDKAGYLGAAKLVANSNAKALITPFESDVDDWGVMLEMGELTNSVKTIERAAQQLSIKARNLHIVHDRGVWQWQ